MFDVFGIPCHLTVNRKYKYKTRVGGCVFVTLFILITIYIARLIRLEYGAGG